MAEISISVQKKTTEPRKMKMSWIKSVLNNFRLAFCRHKAIEILRLDSMTAKVLCSRCSGLFIFHERPKIYETWSQASENICLNYAIAEKAFEEIRKQAEAGKLIIPKQENLEWGG